MAIIIYVNTTCSVKLSRSAFVCEAGREKTSKMTFRCTHKCSRILTDAIDGMCDDKKKVKKVKLRSLRSD